MEAKILIIDDDDAIRDLIGLYLENEGFKVEMAATADEGLAILAQQELDLLILDVMLPGRSGIEACLEIRKRQHLPIIMVSAKSEDIDKIHGLASGADDYLTKPFSPLELISRVKSQLRRYKQYNHGLTSTAVIEIGDLTINTETRQVCVGEREVRLTPKEFDILEYLARNKGVVLSIQKIYEAVWREDFFKSDNTVMVHITKLREKIEPDPKKPIYIKTVWGVGYKL